jgi:hypothetical protein
VLHTRTSSCPNRACCLRADPLTIALTRVGGIVSGVATMLLMSILILPKSATIESLHT